MKILALILLLLPTGFFLLAQNKQPAAFHFNHLGIKDGLPEGTITVLMQDSQGYFWMGTQNGLVRYDGYTIKKYNLFGNFTLSNAIDRVFEDKKRNLWIGTFNGLYFYDRLKDTVFRYMLSGKNNKHYAVSFFLDDREGNVWILFYDLKIKTHCLGFLNTSTSDLTVFSNKEKGDQYLNTTEFIFSLYIDQQNKLWILGDNNLFEYYPAEKKFKAHYFDSAHKTILWFESEDAPAHEDYWFLTKEKNADNWNGIGKYNIKSRSLKIFNNMNFVPNDFSGLAGRNFTDSRKRIWFCLQTGMMVFDPAKGNFTRYDIKEKKIEQNDNAILWAIEDKSGNLWCWSGRGLVFLNTINGNFTRLAYNEMNPDGLLSNYISHLFLDMHGLPWFGVSNAGLQWLNKDRSKFTLYTNFPGQWHHFPGGEVNSIAEAPDGTRWIGSQKGLYHWLPAKDSFIFIRYEKNLSKDVLTRAVFVDRNGLVWFGAYGDHDSIRGLYCYDPATKKSKNYQYHEKDTLSLSNNYIWCILQDNDGKIWVGTRGGGLCALNKPAEKFTRIPFIIGDFTGRQHGDSLDDDNVLCMFQDKTGMLWIGTNRGGLNKYDPKSGTFKSFVNKLPGFSCVVSITDDQDGNIWAGTYMGGLFSVNLQTNKLKKISESEGLLYDGCRGINKDRKGNIWIASPRGMSILNPQTNQIRSLNVGNCLPREPSSFFLCATSNGNFLYGSKDGFVGLNPDDFSPDTIVPVVHIETVAFTQAHMEKANGKDSLVVRYGKNKINLKYNENRITFSYVGLLYHNAPFVRYAYKLDGYDENWIQAGIQRTVTYTNLSPGTYLFHVKAANSDGVWTKLEDAITIIIEPPWWLTWWAYGLYFALFAATLTGFIKWRLSVLRKQKAFLEEKLKIQNALMNERSRISRELHDEVGATLSGIAMYSHLTREQLKNAQTTEVEKSLSTMQQSAGEMVNKLNDIVWLTNPGQDSLKKMVQRLEEYATDMAIIKNIQVKVNVPANLGELSLPVETRRNIYLFCKEAINNAVKYSSGSLLEFKVKEINGDLEFSVSDNGKGFDEELARRGNGLNNMQNRADEIGAKLTMQSKPNEGCFVSMQLKSPNGV